MEDTHISLVSLISELAGAMTQDSGRSVSTEQLKELLLEEAKSENVILRDDSSATVEEMWLLFSGWKFRIGQALGLLDADPNQHDFWEQPMPQTKAVFSRLSRKVVYAITAFARLHERETGVSVAAVLLESGDRNESLQQTYARAAFRTQGLQVIRSHL